MCAHNTEKNLRLLLIEDSENDELLIVRAIKKDGYVLHHQRVDTAEAMIQALQDQQWDIVVSDHNMPNFSAPAALEILQNSDIDIPFIVVSGSIGEEYAVNLMKLGVTDYLLKDRLSRLPGAIEHALNEHQLRKEHEQMMQALQQSEIKFKTIFEESLDIIAIIEPETGIILNINPAVERILRFPAESLPGEHFSILFKSSDNPDIDIIPQVNAMDSVFLSETFYTRDGGMCLLDVTTTIIPWENDRAVMLTLRDATERLQMEAATRTAEMLRVQLEKEKELHELKNRFISMASHEFRTPLTTIQLSANLLQSHLDKMDDIRRAKHFGRITESVDHTTALLEDVLTIGQAEANALEFHPEVVDIDAFCHEMIDTFQNAHEKHQLVYEASGDCSQIKADVKLLRHVFTNLLSNAIKYSPQGSQVTLQLHCQPDKVKILFKDQGIGIPPKDQKRLFQTFFRASNVGNISGTGLGLAIAYHAVEKHGGTIACESVVGEGTTFIITLPRNVS